MQLAILLAVVCALAQGEAGSSAPAGEAMWRAVFAGLGMLAAPLVACLGARGVVKAIATGAQSRELALRLARLSRGSTFVWLAMVAATVYILDWPRIVRSNWGLAAWPLADEILILAPVVLPLLLVWGARYRLQWRAQCMRHQLSDTAQPAWRPIRHVWLKAREHLGLILVPALVVIGLQELTAASWFQTRFGQASSWLFLPVLAMMLILLPVVLRRLWRTSALPAGPLRERLFSVCREQHIGIREILVWHTPDLGANAAVAGLVPGLRYVFLTDGLLRQLSDDEVAAALRHELGHIEGRHLVRRMLLLALPLAAYLGLNAVFPAFCERVTAALASAGIAPQLQMSLVVPAGLLAYAVFIVGRYSHWLEHEADLAACRGQGGAVDLAAKDCFLRALAIVVGPGRESQWANWLHPSFERRRAFLEQACADLAWSGRFCRQLRISGWALLGFYVLIAAALAVGEGQAMPAAAATTAATGIFLPDSAVGRPK